MKTCNQVRKEFKATGKVKAAVVDIISILLQDQNTAWTAMKYINEKYYFDFSTPYVYKDNIKVGLDIEVVSHIIDYVLQDEARDFVKFKKMLFAMGHNNEIKIDKAIKRASTLCGMFHTRTYRYNKTVYYIAF